MNKTKWPELSVTAEKRFSTVVEDFVTNLGSGGVVTESKPDHPDKGHYVTVKGYFSGEEKETQRRLDALDAFIEALSGLFPSLHFTVKKEEIEEKDWQKWKEFFKPVKVSERIVVKPSWENYSGRLGELIVEIDPGMAFGTGTHETTKLCITLLDRLVKGGETILDLGTGSGVLAIAASKLGAGFVLAVDNDKTAVKAALDNVIKNGLSGKIEVSSVPIDELKGTFDIIVANILADDLIAMKNSIIKRLSKNGKIILSGILAAKAASVIKSYPGFNEVKVSEDGEWCAIQFNCFNPVR